MHYRLFVDNMIDDFLNSFCKVHTHTFVYITATVFCKMHSTGLQISQSQQFQV